MQAQQNTKPLKKVLLVEDEASVASIITKGLSENNFEVSVAFDGATGVSMALSNSYDILIIDIMLPGKNGLEVCRELRSRELSTPILILTALGASENIAHGLDLGADDYLVKPFKFIELNARINALLRRSLQQEGPSTERKNVFLVADLVVDDDAKTVSRNNTPVSLTATEYRLLLVLIRNRGRVMSRMELLEGAWDINFNMGTNVVDVYINYLRKKLESGSNTKLIHTVTGRGYVLKES